MSNKRCLLVAVLMTSFCILAHANASSVLLKQGATGDAVWELQLSLFQRGFLHMTPTGLFDATTLDAVRRFQEENGLVIDGIVGRQTWLSLQRPFLPNHNRPTKCAVVILCGAWPATMASPLR